VPTRGSRPPLTFGRCGRVICIATYAGEAGTNRSDVAFPSLGGGQHDQPLMERYADRIAGVLSCYDRLDHRNAADGVLRRRDDAVFQRRGNRYLRLPRVHQDAARTRPRDRCGAGVGGRRGDRALGKPHVRKEDVVARVLVQRGDRPGACAIGDGSLRRLQTMARQADPQDLHPAGQRQVPHYYFYFMDGNS
jgi:hypothetical protein